MEDSTKDPSLVGNSSPPPVLPPTQSLQPAPSPLGPSSKIWIITIGVLLLLLAGTLGYLFATRVDNSQKGSSKTTQNNVDDMGTTETTGDTADEYDTEIKSDITQLSVRIELYYTENGYYPSEDDMDTPAEMIATINVNADTVVDPDGKLYRYSASPDGCSTDCEDFRISGVLSSGEVFSKSAF